MNKREVEEQLSPEEIAERLNVDISTVFRWMKVYRETDGKEGLGPCRKLGRRTSRVPASGVNRFLESRTV
jgi:transposase